MIWGKTAKTASAPRDAHAGLIAVLTVITTLGIAARLLAPLGEDVTLAAAPAEPEPARAAWFSLSFEDVAR